MALKFFIKKHTQSLSGKVVLALLLASVAIIFSWGITQLSFRQMLNTVNELSSSNPKLQLVNRLFIDVVQLEQLQRAQALEPQSKSTDAFFNESKNIRLMLDSLQTLCIADSQQMALVLSMKDLLQQRDKLYLNYLSMRTEYVNNDTLNKKLKSLTELLNKPAYNADSNIVTTESRKIITTTVVPAENEKDNRTSLWERVFGKKKNSEQPKQLVKEELNITTDTMKVANVDSALIQLSKTIARAEVKRSNIRRDLISRQVQLNQTGNVFIGQLLDILNRMELEETMAVEQSNAAATVIVNRNLWRLNLLIIVFIAGAAFLTFLILTDIIRSNKYKDQLIVAKEEAEELGMVKQRFLANMSHELRTPLQAIVGMAEQVSIKGRAEQQDINMIYQSSQHLLQIVNEVLDYSLITSGKFRLEDKVFNITELLDEVSNVMQVKAVEKKLELIYEPLIDKSMNHIGDPFRLKQILYNLLGNAIKFTDNGNVTLKAEQKDFNAYSLLSFTIKDTGRGIKEKDLETIFNQFEQGNTSAPVQQQGTGLGLSIVQSLTDRLKGNIHVDSKVDVGSVFTITIPYTIAKEEDISIEHRIVPLKDFNIGEIWVIDDDPLILQLCSHILSKHKLQHTCFTDPHKMLLMVEAQSPEIILMDIRMPHMTGFELLQKMKPHLASNTKVYALTAHALPEDREDLLRPGFNDVLMKPFMEHDLLHLLMQNTTTQPTGTKSSMPDLNDLRKMTGGDEVLFKEILEQFIKETEKDNRLLLQCIRNNKPKQAAEQLHKLAGRCGQIGFKETSINLRRTETKLRKTSTITHELQHAHQQLQDAIAQVRQYLTV